MENSISEILLEIPEQDAEESIIRHWCKQLDEYYENNPRHCYAEITDFILSQDGGMEYAYKIKRNLLGFVENGHIESKSQIIKLLDHISLETVRHKYLCDMVNNNARQVFLELNNENRVTLEVQYNSLNDKYDKLYKDMEDTKEDSKGIYSQFVAVLGIFSAIIIVFFGGASVFSEIFKNLKELRWYEIGIGVSFTGIVLFDIIFMFLYILSKLINRSISAMPRDEKGNESKDISNKNIITRVWKRYPYVICGNVLLLCIIIVCVIGSYIFKQM